PLFGKQGRTPIGPAYMNVKYGSPILPAYIVPHPKKSQWTIYVGDPLKLISNQDGLSERELILENSKIVNKAMERIIIKTYPNWLYLMLFHKLKEIQ
ncbi:MAG: LpxL/LpxP family acyltransferase, partial [Candidatus Helarchaeota archaeon]